MTGIRKCVPSPVTVSFTPENLSNITALHPASTENIDEFTYVIKL